MLREAGWNPHGTNVREYEVHGMPTEKGIGYADYVLWGDTGLPLAVIEAKKTKRSPTEGERQAELYANCLEKMHGQRPVIFYSNGYETWLWDDRFYAPRRVAGFFSKNELQLMVNRRTERRDIRSIPINTQTAGRPYQQEAIRRVAESFSKKKRRCLLAMSMGTGKTRTAVAIAELMMKSNWALRVLFLADRTELVDQAAGAFKEHLPTASIVNLLQSKEDDKSRIVVSTYPTMMNAIDERKMDGASRFSPGYFDLIFLDEVHRSVYKKYGAIFEYFDSLIIGLTATPRDDVSRNTYQFLELEEGFPTFAYDLETAVRDRFLVPYKAALVPIKFPREGIKYDDLSEEEQEEYEELFYDEETGTLPPGIEPPALNSWVFNTDTVDKVLTHVVTHGIKVAGGDRLGKTIVFAKNHAHAEFIKERFNQKFPEYGGHFLRVIDHQINYAKTLISDFKGREKSPHIAVSVDMLDTGIDIPEVVNLVFFKAVKSKVKFRQMVGRGTRLCPDVFGVGRDKTHFLIFDFCGNFEFFDEHPDGVETKPQDSLSQRIFKKRLDLALEMRKRQTGDLAATKFITRMLDFLHHDISTLNPESLLVRPKQKFFRPFLERKRWEGLNDLDVQELSNHVSDVVRYDDPDEYAKRFDYLIHNLQVAVVCEEAKAERLKESIREIVNNLTLKKNIPVVQEQMETLRRLQTDEFWTSVTVSDLEDVRERLRSLVRLLDREESGTAVISHFEDEVDGDIEEREKTGAQDFADYRKRVERLIRELESSDTTIYRLKHNRPINAKDIKHLEELLFKQAGTHEDYEKSVGEVPLGIFIRGIVGLDRAAAREAFADFLSSGDLSADQIRFVDVIIDHLTKNGTISPDTLYEQPFTDLHSHGPDGLFEPAAVRTILSIVQQVERNAGAA